VKSHEELDGALGFVGDLTVIAESAAIFLSYFVSLTKGAH
jgi:hypothetical protein